MPYSIELPDGAIVEDIPDNITPEQAKARIIAAFPKYAPVPKRTWAGSLGDTAVVGTKGVVGALQGIIGLADIPANLLGLYAPSKTLAGLGLKPAEAQKILDTMYSPAQQEAEKRVQKAEGFTGTLKALAENPSVIATTAGQAPPQMIGGASIARGITALAPKVAPWLAGAAGEGVLGAGSAMKEISEGAKGEVTPDQAAKALLSGAGTAAFGVAGSRASKLLGGTDIDTMLAQGARKAASEGAESVGKTVTKVPGGTREVVVKPPGFLSQMARSGLSEGVFEELPQSVQEKMIENWALGKPWDEGLGKAAAMGLTVGAAMGVAGGGFSASRAKSEYQKAVGEEKLKEQVTEKAKQETNKAAVREERNAQIAALSDEDLAKLLVEIENVPSSYERNSMRKAAREELASREASAAEAPTAEALEEAETARVERIADTERGMANIAAIANAPVTPPERFTPAQREANIVETERGMANIAELANQPVPPRAAYEPTPLIRQEVGFDRAAPEPRPAVVMPSTVDQIASGLDTKYTSYIPWFNNNVFGKSLEDVRAVVEQDPKLVQGTSARAKILRELLAPVPEAYVEPKPDVITATTPTNVPAVAEAGTGVGEPSVGVPSGDLGRPAPTEPAAPVGGGLASPVVPPAPRVEPEAPIPTELTEIPSGTQAPETIETEKEGPAQPAAPAPTAVKAPAPTPPVGETPAPAPAKPRATDKEREARVEELSKKANRIAAGRQWAGYAHPAAPKFGALPVEAQDRWADAYKAGKLTMALSDELAATVAKPAPAPKAEAPKPAPAPKAEAPKPAPKAEEPSIEEIDKAEEAEEDALQTAAEADVGNGPIGQAIEKVESGDLETKAQIRKFVNTLERNGVLDDVEDVREALSDREQSAEDALYILESLLTDARDTAIEERVEELREEKRDQEEAKPVPKAEASKPAPKAEEPEVKHTWVDSWANNTKGWAGYVDADVAILVVPSDKYGIPLYLGVTREKDLRTVVDISRYEGPLFTADQKAKLLKERERLVAEDTKNIEAFPEGPFTGATTNVVASPEFDPRYTAYLTELMQKMGLGNIRVLLVHPEGARANREALHLHGSYASALSAGIDSSEDGSVRQFGPKLKDFYISLRPGMSEAVTFETLNHELGHIIEKVAYNNASPETKQAIRTEFEAWLSKVKGGSAKDLVYALRNRETAEAHVTSASDTLQAKDIRNLEDYWGSFKEWFADNTSKWATTNEKPLSVADKFFSKLAQKLRDLVAIVTGRQYPPAKSVAKFLNEMGPGSAAMWAEPSVVSEKGAPAQQAIPPTTTPSPVSALINSLPQHQQVPATAFVQAGQGLTFLGSFQALNQRITKFRTLVTDRAATVSQRLAKKFNNGVRDGMGNVNSELLYRQAEAAHNLNFQFFKQGSLQYDAALRYYKVASDANVPPPSEVFDLIKSWGAATGRDFKAAYNDASELLEAARLREMRNSNNAGTTDFNLHRTDAWIDTNSALYDADPRLAAMNASMDKTRKALIDEMVAAGRITAEMGNNWKDAVAYVPFDREGSGEALDAYFRQKRRTGRGPAQLGSLPVLKGSTERPIKNVFENNLNTLAWMVTQTVKNRANVEVMRDLQSMPSPQAVELASRDVPDARNNPDRIVTVYIDGIEKPFLLNSTYDVMAFVDRNPPVAGVFKQLGRISNVLRTSITAVPTFSVKQVAEDIQRMALHSGITNVAAASAAAIKNFTAISADEILGKENPAVKFFGERGIVGGVDWSENNSASEFLRSMGVDPRNIVHKGLGNSIYKLDAISRASDLAIRKAIYDQTMEETGDEALALSRAREIINFRKRGAGDKNGWTQSLLTSVTFFNSYVQGTDVLYRSLVGENAVSGAARSRALKMFWSRAALMTAVGIAYALGKGDDDEYDRTPVAKRDKTWMISEGFGIPVASELGILFKVIPERVAEYYRRKGTPQEQVARQAVTTYLRDAAEVYAGRVNPIPTALRPLAEVGMNYSFLTSRPLVGIQQKGVEPWAQANSRTSEFAKTVAKYMKLNAGVEVSPISIDTYLTGYFGTTASLTLALSDAITHPDKVDRPLHTLQGLAPFMYDQRGQRNLGEFYKLQEKVLNSQRTLDQLAKTSLPEAQAYFEKNKEMLAYKSLVHHTLDQLERSRAFIKDMSSETYKNIPKEEREDKVKFAKEYENKITAWVRDAEKNIR